MDICIFDKNKQCNTCGNCDICDLNPKKICDNCGKCLELDGVDIKAINIEDIAKKVEENEVILEEVMEESLEMINADSEEEEVHEFEDELDLDVYKNFDGKIDMTKFNEDFKLSEEGEDAWDHIEYIDDIQDILFDKNALERYSIEEFPGLIRINKSALEKDAE